MAFQFHQHNHQHQHTHTHQHFTPFLTPATASPMVRETLLFYSCFKLHCSWNVLTHLNCFCLFSSISTQARWTGCTDTLWVSENSCQGMETGMKTVGVSCVPATKVCLCLWQIYPTYTPPSVQGIQIPPPPPPPPGHFSSLQGAFQPKVRKNSPCVFVLAWGDNFHVTVYLSSLRWQCHSVTSTRGKFANNPVFPRFKQGSLYFKLPRFVVSPRNSSNFDQ